MNIKDFEKWHELADSASDSNASSRSAAQFSGLARDTRFAVNAAINRKLIFCKHRLVDVACDAIVNPTNEKMNATHGVALDVLEAGGDELRAAIAAHGEGCKTGHVVRTVAGGGLPAAHVIHTVGPRYSDKYHTAAVNALHNCYRNAMHEMREAKLRTVAFAALHTQRKGYLPEVGAHVALRTLRRYLEHHGDAFDCVMLCMVEGGVNYGIYKRLVPLYFPRNAAEAKVSYDTLPDDCGDENGEMQIAERQIRIAEALADNASAKSAAERAAEIRGRLFGASESSVLHDDQLRPAMLSRVTADNDEQRQRAVRATLAKRKATQERSAAYQVLETRALSADLSSVARTGYVYRAGPDKRGRDIVVFIAARLPAAADLERVLLYIVSVLAPLRGRDFSVVYIHGGTTSANDPPFSWFRRLYALLDYPHGSNMQAFYVVHPTFLLKVGFTIHSAFLSSDFNDKVLFLHGMKELYTIFTEEQIGIQAEKSTNVSKK